MEKMVCMSRLQLAKSADDIAQSRRTLFHTAFGYAQQFCVLRSFPEDSTEDDPKVSTYGIYLYVSYTLSTIQYFIVNPSSVKTSIIKVGVVLTR